MDHFGPRGRLTSKRHSTSLLVQNLCNSFPRDLGVLVDNLKPYTDSVGLQRCYESASSSEEGIHHKLPFLREEADEFSYQRFRKGSRMANLLVAAGLRSMDEPGFCEFYPFSA